MNPVDRWRAVMEARGIPGPAKAVLGCLAFHAGGVDLEAWPSLKTIAEETGFAETAVRAAIRSLTAQGLIEQTEPGGGRHPNRYRLHLRDPLVKRTPRETNPSPHEPQPLASRASAPRETNPNKKRTGKEHRNGQLWIWFEEEFWPEYPKKKNKLDARKAWKSLNPDRELQATILDAVRRQKLTRDWQKDGGQFIPHPATWLNGRRWEDEIDAPRPASTTLDRKANSISP